MNVFTAIADPTRRRMLELFQGGELPAGELAGAFPGASQPGLSRHLRVLREAGLVDVRHDEQRRMYSLRPQGFAELDAWISHYRDFWPTQLDALSRHLDAQAPTARKASSSKKSTTTTS